MNDLDESEFEEYEEVETEFDEEYFFTCPYCWQEISMVFDLTVEEQSYIEDCEVCCRPIQISYNAEDFQIISFSADIAE